MVITVAAKTSLGVNIPLIPKILSILHTGLPQGKPLRNNALRVELTNMFMPPTADEMIKKLATCSSTQGNESFNSLVSCLKTEK